MFKNTLQDLTWRCANHIGIEWDIHGLLMDPKMGNPQVTMCFNTKSWSNDLDDLGYPYCRKPPYGDIQNI